MNKTCVFSGLTSFHRRYVGCLLESPWTVPRFPQPIYTPEQVIDSLSDNLSFQDESHPGSHGLIRAVKCSCHMEWPEVGWLQCLMWGRHILTPNFTRTLRTHTHHVSDWFTVIKIKFPLYFTSIIINMMKKRTNSTVFRWLIIVMLLTSR